MDEQRKDNNASSEVFGLSDENLDQLVDSILNEGSTQAENSEEQVLDFELTEAADVDETEFTEADISAIMSSEPAAEEAEEQEPVSEDTVGNLSIWGNETANIPQLENPMQEKPLPNIGPFWYPKRNYRAQQRKRRPAQKPGYGLLGIPQILSACVWILLVLAVGITFGRILWVCAADVLAFGRESQQVEITVPENYTIDDVAQMLHENGLVRYPKLFATFCNLTHAEEDIAPGTYTLDTIYDYHALVNGMENYDSPWEVVTITVPPGFNSYQIFRLLEREAVCSVADLEEYSMYGNLPDYWFLQELDRSSGNCLEGFLYPDTYEFYQDDSAERVVDKFLTNFNVKFTDRMINEMDNQNERLAQMMYNNGYGEEYVSEHSFGIREILAVASLIEKESAGPQESYTIASVFYNRLTDLGSYPFLNSDATVFYALGPNVDHDELTAADLAVDSPYNTYVSEGLTPGPICSPGMDSILAALMPEDTDYYYFIYDEDIGWHHFSSSLEEHEAYAAEMD